MPMDDFFAYRRERIGWQFKRCLWPRKCAMSKQNLWGKKAYKGTLMITGPGDPIFITHWLSREQFLISKIRGTI
jgi:hypothetical protein